MITANDNSSLRGPWGASNGADVSLILTLPTSIITMMIWVTDQHCHWRWFWRWWRQRQRQRRVDAPLQRFLGRMAPGSSAATRSSIPFIAQIILLALNPPDRRGGGRKRPHSCTAFAVVARHFSRFAGQWFEMSAASPWLGEYCSAASPWLTEDSSVAALTVSAIRWPGKPWRGGPVPCGNEAGSARGSPGKAPREAPLSSRKIWPSDSLAPPWRRMAIVGPPSLNASASVRLAASSQNQILPFLGTSQDTWSTSLVLLQTAPSTVICLRSACCSKLLHANRRIQHLQPLAARTSR